MIRRIVITILAVALAAAALAVEPLQLDRWDKFTYDTELKRDGKPTFLWPAPAENTSVVCYNVPDRDAGTPADLTPYNAIRFWVHCQEPKESIITLVIRSENPESKGIDYYNQRFTTDFAGWQEFVWFLPQMGAARQPLGWDQIGQVMFSSNWARKIDPETVLHFSDIEFVFVDVPGLKKEAGEILGNRSFELLAKKSPVGYGLGDFSSDSKIVVDNTVAHSGERSVRIDGATKGRAGIAATFRGKDADPTKKYVFSAWVKKEGKSDSKVGTCVRFTSVAKPKKVLKSDVKPCDAEPHDWKKYEWEVELPEGTEFVNVVLFHYGTGKAWWDDVSLKMEDK